jgi:hypothetical protein
MSVGVVDPNAKDNEGRTCLHLACMMHAANCVQVLTAEMI